MWWKRKTLSNSLRDFSNLIVQRVPAAHWSIQKSLTGSKSRMTHQQVKTRKRRHDLFLKLEMNSRIVTSTGTQTYHWRTTQRSQAQHGLSSRAKLWSRIIWKTALSSSYWISKKKISWGLRSKPRMRKEIWNHSKRMQLQSNLISQDVDQFPTLDQA